jgi:hypothetical protein
MFGQGGAFLAPQDAGGELTREAFDRAVDAVRRDAGVRPSMIVTSQRTIDAGRAAADAACAVAMWAHRELAELPWWRWLRRRFLERTFDEHAAGAESLWSTFGLTDGGEGH